MTTPTTSSGQPLDAALFAGRRILVTGATGLFGRALTDRLIALGAHVRATSSRPPAIALPAGVEHK